MVWCGLEHLKHPVGLEIGQNPQQEPLLMMYVRDRGQGDEHVDVPGQRLVDAESCEGLQGALGVTDVGDGLGAGGVDDVLDVCRQVVESHLVVGEVPEGLAVDGQGRVVGVVCVPSVVAEPHVVTCGRRRWGGGYEVRN